MPGRSGLDRARLDRAIIDAFDRQDLGRLAALYADAAGRSAASGATDAACFFWTQAWIYALDAGQEGLARELEEQLRRAGRLGPQPAQGDPRP